MTFAFAAGPFFAFMLALVRASAWLALVPPFSSSAIPKVVRLGLAAALALAAVSQLSRAPGLAASIPTLSTAGFISDLVLQAVTGFCVPLIGSKMVAAASPLVMSVRLPAALSTDSNNEVMKPSTLPVTA